MSNRGVLNLILAGILLSLLWLSAVIQPQRDRRAVEFLPEMIYPVAAESFSASEVLPAGMVEQRPVDGTIARGRMPLHLEPGPEGALRAAADLSNPLTVDDEADLERGTKLFQVYCQLCHGPTGEGDGPVAQRGFPAPPSLLLAHALEMSDGQIFHVASLGQGNMPGHAPQIDVLDRWRIILRVRQLQGPAMASLAGVGADAPVPATDSPPRTPALQTSGEGR